jgi:hypothetical protein
VRYVFRSGQWVPRDEAPPRNAGPFVLSDIPAYKSPLGTGWVEGRTARREELKRSNCREVDPSEWRDRGVYTNPRYQHLNK